MNRNVVGTFAVALALGVAGCGSAGPLSKADFASKANAICKERTAEAALLFKKHAGDTRAFIAAAVPTADKSLAQLEALKPPSELQATYKRLLAAQRVEVESIKQYVASGAKGVVPGSTGPQQHLRSRLATSLGIEDCS